MTTDRWQHLQDLFHRAVALPPAARDPFVIAHCGDDQALRRELELLLRGDESGDDAVSRIDALTRAAPKDPLLDTSFGPWRLSERIGSGGMGVVYRGQRADGLFEQEVALKVIRAETATDWMLRRFEVERRTLAALQHPGIARLFDGGTTAEGNPWFAMELVHGEAIDRYCERNQLPLAARLRLFLQVCRAVQFAHQNLVVHCDLKPGNILIDDRGQPRLLDFGIARLLEDESGAAAAGGARTVVRLLTPDYASPEQLAGAAVTTAHDVYSLGVILHELATERLPLVRGDDSPADWERTVREQIPERPSTRVVRTEAGCDPAVRARHFRSTPAGLRRALRGDLDRIVLMALRKEPQRRYASVQEFAEDIEHHLAGLPVRARPNSLLYRTTKFVRRNRVAVAAGLAVVVALLAGLVAARRSERRAQAEARHAATEADSFQSIADFLMDAFLPASPAQDPAWQQRARERILAHSRRVHRQHADSDHERANLLDILGHVCLRLDLFADAEQLMREALAIRGAAFGADSLEYALSLRSLGQLQHSVGDYQAAAGSLTEALELHRRHATDTHADVAGLANDLAACLHRLDRDPEAEVLHREALMLRRGRGPGSLAVAESLNNLAGILMARGDHALAAADLREAMAIRSEILGDGHALTLQTLSNLGNALWREGERTEALALMHRGEQAFRTLGADGEDGLAVLLANLAAMAWETGDLDAATTCLEEALTLQARRLGRDHPHALVTRMQLAQSLHAQQRDDRAGELWDEVVATRRAQQAPAKDLADALLGQGAFLLDTGATARAQTVAAEAVTCYRRQEPNDPAAVGRAELLLGRCHLHAGDRALASDHVRMAVPLLDAAAAVTAPERARAHRLLDAIEADAPR